MGGPAALSAGAATIHFAVVFENFAEYALYGAFLHLREDRPVTARPCVPSPGAGAGADRPAAPVARDCYRWPSWTRRPGTCWPKCLALFPARWSRWRLAPVDMTSADLDELDEDLDEDEEDDERAGHTRRWVRYVMPVMVEVDCDTDEIKGRIANARSAGRTASVVARRYAAA